MNTKALRTAFVAILLGIALIAVSAFTMEPMSTLLGPSGARSIATFRVKNDGKERVAIRFRVLIRDLSPDGQEVNAAADDLFVVYPARLLVEPGMSASAKVQWRGPAKVESERSFRFVAEQILIDAASAQDGGSGIKVMFRYIASLYVGEPAFAPNLVVRVTGSTGPHGENGFLVEIDNTGLRHVVDNRLRIGLTGEDVAPFSREELGNISGANYLPGTGRKLFISRPEAIPGKNYAAKIDYESEY